MTRRTTLATLATLATAAVMLPLAAHADTLEDILANKQINIAVPTDFPPYGFVGTDLKPQGLDIDMANLIGARLGVKVELGAGDQRQPHPLPADEEGRPGDQHPGQEPRTCRGDRLHRRLLAVLPGGVCRQGRVDQGSGRPGRQDGGRDPRRHRGHGADQDRSGHRRHQAFRGQQHHRVGLRLGPGAGDRHRSVGGRQHDDVATRSWAPNTSSC